jgi:hypothetical protein
MGSSLQDSLEFFGIFFRTSTLQIDQFALRNTDRSRIKFINFGLVYLGLPRSSRIFNLTDKQTQTKEEEAKNKVGLGWVSEWEKPYITG